MNASASTGARRALRLLVLCAALTACRDRRPDNPDVPTADELAAFQAPADSAITPAQVEGFLRAAVAQLALIREEGPAMRSQTDVLRARSATPPGAPRRTAQAAWSDFIDATWVRASRESGLNPAELTYVRSRMAAVNGALAATRLHQAKDQAAALFRQQAEAMRGQPGSEAQVQQMLQGADQAERQAAPPRSPKVAQNLETLRRARPGVDDAILERLTGFAAGAELAALLDLPVNTLSARLDTLEAALGG